ncbi:hypothetical protein B0T37_04400 [Chromobacterium violaceum]|nr:hypothetical protein B0T38_02890 [Chromobacterium violaceum]OQS29214.1 hypothetical protein B0T37_04400 [Chromobacterium violaceum]
MDLLFTPCLNSLLRWTTILSHLFIFKGIVDRYRSEKWLQIVIVETHLLQTLRMATGTLDTRGLPE